MNKIGLKEIVTLCVSDIHGYTPREAFDLMTFHEPHGYWSMEIKGAYLYLVYRYKRRMRMQKIVETKGHFSHLALLQAISACYGVTVDETNPYALHEWKEWIVTLDFSKPTLLLVK